MKRKKNIAFLLILFVLCSGLFFGYLFFKNDEINMQAAKTDVHVNAEEFLASLLKDKQKVSQAYIEKVIEVKGKVKEVNFLNDRYTVILEGGDQIFTCVMCDMQKDQLNNIRNLKSGEAIRLKGVFKGFLNDAIFLNCILIQDPIQDE